MTTSWRCAWTRTHNSSNCDESPGHVHISADRWLWMYTATPPPRRSTRSRQNREKSLTWKLWSMCFFFKWISLITATSALYPMRSAARCSTAWGLVNAAAFNTYRVGKLSWLLRQVLRADAACCVRSTTQRGRCPLTSRLPRISTGTMASGRRLLSAAGRRPDIVGIAPG